MSEQATIAGDEFLTVAEAAKALTLSYRHTQRLAGTEIPCVRIGPKSLRFRRSDLEAFIEARTEGASKRVAK